MKLVELITEGLEPPTGVLTAYHGGNDFEGGFNLKMSGTGEGYRILGPGMYFITNKLYAQGYAKKYAKTERAAVYTVEIDCTDFYAFWALPTPAVKQAWQAILQELGYANWEAVPKSSRTLQNGRGAIGTIVGAVGHQKALELFIKHGIRGAVEHIDEGIWEICVFDMKVVKMVKKEYLDELTQAS